MNNTYKMVNKLFKGFTLSEVLVTLVIIGVVAALTVPVIFANANDRERAARIRKVYSTLNQALTLAQADGADFEIVERDHNLELITKTFDDFLKPYLSTIKVCYNQPGCWNSGDTKFKNGSNAYTNRTGIGVGTHIITAILNDGSFINFDAYGAASLYRYFGVRTNRTAGYIMYFDINGERGPNEVGKDIFVAVFAPDTGFVPAYRDKTHQENINDCKSRGTGISCINRYLSNAYK